MVRVLPMAFLIGLVVPGAAMGQIPPPQTPHVTTQGEGIVKRAADRAWITIAAETRDQRAPEARRRNAEVMTELQRAVRAVGLAGDAIRTTGNTLTPEMEYSNGRSTLRGYVARNQIEVRIDEIDKVSEVIDAANTPRSAALVIGSPRFDLKNRGTAEAEALRIAVRAALDRARAIADGAGRSVGAILRIDDQNLGPVEPPRPMFRTATAEMAQGAPETPITPGDIEVRASVTLTIELR